jgi:hypothetical protein
MVEKLNGNDFPYIAGTWAQPLVQEVLVPAHVQGGVFYPEHYEWAIITPGEWKKSPAYPLSSRRHEHDERPGEKVTASALRAVDITALGSTELNGRQGD